MKKSEYAKSVEQREAKLPEWKKGDYTNLKQPTTEWQGSKKVQQTQITKPK